MKFVVTRMERKARRLYGIARVVLWLPATGRQIRVLRELRVLRRLDAESIICTLQPIIGCSLQFLVALLYS